MSNIKVIDRDFSKCPAEGCTATFGKPGVGPTNINEEREKNEHITRCHSDLVRVRLQSLGLFREAHQQSTW